MPTPCIIRFTDNQSEIGVHVMRKRHGHPEEIVSNLTYLNIIVDSQRGELSTGNVAAQFVSLDTFWYVIRNVRLGDLEEEIMTLLFSSVQADSRDEYSYLRQHVILDSRTSVEPVSFLYQVELNSETSDWQVDIAHNSDSISGRVEEVFEGVSWGFSGGLSEAERQF